MKRLLENFGKLYCIQTNRSYSKQEFLLSVEKKLKDLLTMSAKPGDRLAIVVSGLAEDLAWLFAGWEAGLSVLPLEKNFTEEQFNNVLIANNIRFFIDSGVLKNTNFKISLSPKLEVPQLLLLSSGTNGFPKCISLDVDSVYDKTKLISNEYGKNWDKVLCALPISFGHGLIANTLSPLLNGKSLYLNRRFRIEDSLALGSLIDSHLITAFSSVPTFWSLISKTKSVKPKLNSLRQIHCASSFLEKKNYSFLIEWCGSVDSYVHYGLTELGSWVSGGLLSPELSNFKFGYVGKIFTEYMVEIENSHLQQSKIGEVTIYHKIIPENRLELADLRNGGCLKKVLKTGDIGYFENEELYLQGRNSDFINIGGEKVSPHEIEELLTKLLGLAEVVVVGQFHELLGESTTAIIKDKNPQIDLAYVRSALKKKIPEHWIPKNLIKVEEFPINQNGKIMRQELRRKFGNFPQR